MRKFIIFFGAGVLVMLLSACNLAGSSQDDCSDGGSLFQDDFSGDKNCGWQEYSRGGTVVEISDGSLNMTTSQSGQIWWTNPGGEFDDVIISTQVRQVSGPDDNAYGVLCRYQDENNYYIFLISGDGYYAIGKYQTGNDQITYLTENGQYEFSDVINQGAATNQLRASCVGNELSLTVNDVPLVVVQDPTFVRGDVGTAVSTLVPGELQISFDDFRVLAP